MFSFKAKAKHPLVSSGVFDLAGASLPYTLKRSAKRKRTIAFIVASNLGLRITAPMTMKVSAIEALLRDRSAWIARRLSDLKESAVQTTPREFVDGDVLAFLGKHYRLRVVRDNAERSCVLSEDVLNVCVPAVDLVGEDLRQEIRFEIISWYKKQAKKIFQERLDLWSSETGITFRRMVVASAERRWGSCSSENIIRLNWRLMMASLPILDYVVVHELCHVVHKNHGPAFWRLVRHFMPDCNMRRDELKRYGASYQLDT